MSTLGESLVKIRLELGHRTAKSFFKYLESRSLECNYQYYVKIEKNIVSPSSNLVNQIAKALDTTMAEELIKSFCSDQFKSFSYLFESETSSPIKDQTKKGPEILQGQKKLTDKQVHVLAQNKDHYHLFLMMTLARRPQEISDLESFKNFKKAIIALKNEGILIQDDKVISAASSEFVFPKAETESLKNHYALFDQWDKDFEEKFSLENILNKMMIRRISPRYLNLIQKQIEVLQDVVRISDESDIRHNNQVIQLQIRLSKGNIPG
ncbi:hypothetical protein DOM21_09775 [Bacteriovorax stolpii]|uniref:hypothetical protein n=1 Tax=Bacteriovorax stolpii TaxID=960 RepID=UPI00115759C9|nr:hypothetical protein [Bacteriovorax stolpii]QDK41735.1 hypothetical protein DOM21_09775 [Bacteriovorax stolpii]